MQHVPGMKGLEMRWTGGWVRDKLLGAQSDDIDVALSTMTGFKFGQALQQFMTGNQEKYENEAQQQGFQAGVKNIHKIKANPEKSKSLETATTKLFGIDIDLVNLRKEVYDDKSRNPTMEFGTAEEDALRRDACVNALFYNIDSQQVEDFTRKGLDDLKNKILRTPLAPYQTFKDDPLRVLRLIRFAARLGFTIHPDALEAMQEPSIHEALVHKISRERVLIEVEKIMRGPRPYDGLKQIYDLGLYMTVFGQTRVEEADCALAMDSLRRILEDCSSICLALRPKDDIAMAWTLAVYVPYRDGGAEGINAARKQLSVSNAVLKVLEGAIKHRDTIRKLVQRTDSSTATRAEVGVALRNCGNSWRFHVLYALLCDTVDHGFREVVRQYGTLITFIEAHRLQNAASAKPIINGNEIKVILNVKTDGSWLKPIIDEVIAWQFANPDASAEDAKNMIAARRNDFNR